MRTITDKKLIEKIFNRGIVVHVIPSKKELFKRLLSGERLRIYIGADPTSDTLHLSHAKNYMFLEELRKLGHEVIVLFGDFTAMIGDPEGRSNVRPQLSEREIKKNVAAWTSQIKPLMDFNDKKNPPRILFNSAWLSKMSWKDELKLAANFTAQQMLERDMFQKRARNNLPIYLHELQYPLMQGYDSVAMNVDVELCGTDQIFNALVGRTLLKRIKNKEKFIIAVNLMENPKTGEIMSKSKGTGVFLSSPPNEMFGAIMAQPDEMTEVFFINNTRIPLEEKDSIMALGPKQAKARVAFEIVKTFYGEEKAKEAEQVFVKTFFQKEIPENIPELKVKENEILLEVVMRSGVPKSKSDARRLIAQNAVRLNRKTLTDPDEILVFKSGDVLKIGKRNFFKLISC